MSQAGTISGILESNAESKPAGSAVLSLDRKPLSHNELCEHTSDVVSVLTGRGLRRNDRIAIVLPNGPEMATAFLAISSGFSAAPLNPAYRDPEFDFYLSDLKARAVIVQAGFDSPVREVAARLGMAVLELQPDSVRSGLFSISFDSEPLTNNTHPEFARPEDEALVLHTSGTTSRPKMVPLSHRNLVASARNISETLSLSEQDLCMNVMPLFHIHGLMACVLASLQARAGVMCTTGFSAPSFIGQLSTSGATWFSAVPTMHQAIVARVLADPSLSRKINLRFVRSSSASLAPTLMGDIEKAFGAPVIEAYGMTEASHQMASNPLPPREQKPGSVGLAAGPEVCILGPDGSLLGSGQVGEIVIRGANVTAGYAENPAANAEAFANGWFRTGDQGTIDEEGYLYITGRLKEIINRGGEKISPREIDEVLLTHPSVLQAVAFALPDEKLGDEVAAAVVLEAGDGVSERELQEYAAERLTDFKIPRRIIFVDEIPKGPTGKLKRVGLADQLGLDGGSRPDVVENDPVGAEGDPGTDTEKALLSIWEDVLKLDEIGVKDDFLSLGGDSILVGQVLSRIQSGFGVQLSFIDFFRSPTIHGLAGSIDEIASTSSGPESSFLIPKAERSSSIPATYGQERMLFLDQLRPDQFAYNRALFLRLEGELDRRHLNDCLNLIIERHEPLRSRLRYVDDRLVQDILPELKIDLGLSVLSGSREIKRSQTKTMTREFIEQPFFYSDGPLVRGELLRIAANEHLLMLVMHHAVFDAGSEAVFIRELANAYSDGLNDREPSRSIPGIRYSDYASWCRSSQTRSEWEKQIDYWVRRLEGTPALEIPTDKPRPHSLSHTGAEIEVTLPAGLITAVNAHAKLEHVTPFMILFGTFSLLLHLYSGQEDITVGVHTSGRERANTQHLIGLFMNMVVMRTKLDGNPSFSDYLSQVRRMAIEAYANQDVPIEIVVEKVHPIRDPSRPPLFQVLFNLEHSVDDVMHAGALSISRHHVPERATDLELSVELIARGNSYTAFWRFNTDLFQEATVGRMAANYEMLLRIALEQPTKTVRQLPFLSSQDKTLLEVLNTSERDFGSVICAHTLFEMQAKQTPDALAVAFEGQYLTYRELDERSNQLARHLQAMGLQPERSVGIYLIRSIETVVAVLGVMKAGGAYVPIRYPSPPSRVAFLLKESDAIGVITTSGTWSGMTGINCPTVPIEDPGIDALPTVPVESDVRPENAVYIIYTSGSTGKPKGITVEHGQLFHFIKRFFDAFRLDEAKNFALLHSLAFDAHHTIFFQALANGGCLHVISESRVLDAESLADYMEENRIDVLDIVPSHLIALQSACHRPERLLPKQRLILSGEASDYAWAAGLARKSDCLVCNSYGPSETVADAIGFVVTSTDRACTGYTPIGRPFPNVKVYVLNDYQQPVPVGAEGELYIGGPSVARGYLGDEELTEECFLSDPFVDTPGARVYRTGDLGRIRLDNDGYPVVHFTGRRDDQIKHKGYRIEPGEIETVLEQNPHVRQAVVVALSDLHGRSRLVAYVVTTEVMDLNSLLDHAREHLPEYMVPAQVIYLEHMPLSANGKIDRDGLPVPEAVRPNLSEAYVAPRTETEIALASIWSDVLEIEGIGIQDNFFDLGGDSLRAIQVQTRIRAFTAAEPSIAQLFRFQTISELARILES